jgi:peptidoglycan/LPS O-acetylase OafA/YrhL
MVINPPIWTNTLSHLIYFGAGVVCAWAAQKRKIEMNRFVRFLFLGIFFLMFAAGAYCLRVKSGVAASSGTVVVLGFAVSTLGCLFLFFSFLNTKFKIPGPIVFLGKISYGLYVWHLMFIVAFRHLAPGNVMVIVPAAFISTVALSILSYHFFELPFLKMKSQFTHVFNKPV